MITIRDTQLDAMTWTPEKGPNINTPVCTDINCANDEDALNVFMDPGVPFGGGLVALSRPVPLINGKPLPFLTVDWEIYPDPLSIKYNRCWELDAKVIWPPAPNPTTKLQNCMDGSCQLAAGQWMIDNAAASWAPVGLPGSLVADEWNMVTVRYQFDWEKMLCSVLSIQQDADAPLPVPASMQKIPALTTNWASYEWGSVPQPLLKLQIQLVCDKVPDPYSAGYCVKAKWSEAAI